MDRTACTEPQCPYSRPVPLLTLWAVRAVQSLSACTVQLDLYSPYGPYGLYKTLVTVQYSYTSIPPMGRADFTVPQCLYSTAIPPLHLWAIRPVQSLSACTVQLYLYSPQCLYSTAITLLPSVPLQYSYTSTPLSTCTVQLYLYSPQCLYSTAIPLLPSVPVQYSYTSTPPMDRTASTEPQCLYSRAISLLPLWTVRPLQSLSACTVELYLYSPYGPYGLYRVSVPVQ